MPVEAIETDQLFGDSPDTGHPDCKCSRCGNVIKEREMPLRMWPTTDGKVTHYEYRYCEKCMTTTMGIYISPRYDDDDEEDDGIDWTRADEGWGDEDDDVDDDDI